MADLAATAVDPAATAVDLPPGASHLPPLPLLLLLQLWQNKVSAIFLLECSAGRGEEGKIGGGDVGGRLSSPRGGA